MGLLAQNWEAQSYWAVLFAKTANTIGLLPEKEIRIISSNPNKKSPWYYNVILT